MYRVMLADDEPIMRKALSTLINWEELDCEVVYTASNGQEVLDNLQNAAPDIIVTDIRMPVTDGIEVAKHIFNNRLPIQVIILTAYADFSYAQYAVKYQVVDYVVKTGVFEGIVEAIEKAKEKLKKSQKADDPENRKLKTENLFKSILDGSLYRKDEILEKSLQLDLHLENYLVMLFHFRLEENISYDRKEKVYESLLNFFHMVFTEQFLQGVFVKRDMLLLVLNQADPDYRNRIKEKCMQVVDMMDNFMKMTVYIGISTRGDNILQLSDYYRQAEEALENSFLDETSKINYYSKEVQWKTSRHSQEIEQELETLNKLISMGKTEEALGSFAKILKLQKEHQPNGTLIKNSGIIIRSKCRKILSEYGKDLYDITEFRHSISNKINSCLHAQEYEKIMVEIISKTAECVRKNTDKKHYLIKSCEQFIDLHFEECITVSDIAEAVGASASYLSRIFKESTGNTIIYTLNQKKIEKAKEYLRDTDMKIYEIADKLGFENTTYFSHFFKKHTGISPKDFSG